ncbi:ABC transporter permease [Rhizobium sp. P28RR-XV]|uniref:ABC transporter permease n=1 Tax=Rhizobium sp. P28RR-XV TaxID=2726737 RepID=UPI001456322B|nr:FtsX-like permease family protein [Rhizobium sp. P28RR-XV]NLR85572.1 ABC transporter permease [Rhizobium sp. P28RR-XV]
MTVFDLVRKSAWRKPLRTTLLMISVATAFLIYGLTTSFVDGSQGSSAASDDILGVMSQAGRTQPLPISYLNRITAEPDVAAVGYMSRLRGFATVEKNIIPVSAVDPRRLLSSNGKELGLTSDLIGALGKDRSTVLVGRALADAQGWTVGQRITVTSFDTAKQDGSRDWAFEIAGIFEGENASTDTYFVIAQYDYVNALRTRNKDTVDAFIVRPQPNISAGELASRIDQLFANSAAPTQTRSEKQFLEAFLRQYADIGLIVNMVVGAAFVTLLMIVGNTMVFAVRERTFEIGLLKTLGFSGSWIMALILCETLLIFLVGGATGLLLALLATRITGPAIGLVFSSVIFAKALGMIVLLALVTGALPALNALRIPITSAFRTR